MTSLGTKIPHSLEEGKQTPSRALAEAMRELIREELQEIDPGEHQDKASPVPTVWDAWWLLVVLTNVALLLFWVPPSWLEALENARLGILAKLVPWLCGGLFLAGATWFRDFLLPFTQSPFFRFGATFSLAVFLFLHVGWLTIHPVVYPDTVTIMIDGEAKEIVQETGLQIPLRLQYKVVISQEGRERTFRPSLLQIVRASLFGHQPHWTLLYTVGFGMEKSDARVHIQKLEGSFTPDFLDELPKHSPGAYSLNRLDKSETELELSLMRKVVELGLPRGKYKLNAQGEGCWEPDTFKAEEIGEPIIHHTGEECE